MMKEEMVHYMEEMNIVLPLMFPKKYVDRKIKLLDEKVLADQNTLYGVVEYIYTYDPLYDEYDNPKHAIALWYLLATRNDILSKYDEVIRYHEALEEADRCNNRIASLKGGLISD